MQNTCPSHCSGGSRTPFPHAAPARVVVVVAVVVVVVAQPPETPTATTSAPRATSCACCQISLRRICGRLRCAQMIGAAEMTAVSRPSAVTSASSYNKPTINAEGSIDSFFGPDEAKEKGDWIRTVPGKGWFPMFRFYRPSEAYFDETWKLGDVVAVSDVPVEVQISGKCRDGTAFPLFHSGRAGVCGEVAAAPRG